MDRDYPILDGYECFSRWVAKLPDYGPSFVFRSTCSNDVTFYEREPLHDCCGISIFNEELGHGGFPVKDGRFHTFQDETISKLRVVLIVVRFTYVDGPGICRVSAELDKPTYAITDYHRVGK